MSIEDYHKKTIYIERFKYWNKKKINYKIKNNRTQIIKLNYAKNFKPKDIAHMGKSVDMLMGKAS